MYLCNVYTYISKYLDPGWINDPENKHNLKWHRSLSTVSGNDLDVIQKNKTGFYSPLYFIGEKLFVLKYSDDNKIQQSSWQHHALLLSTAHLSSRDLPSCLTFAYQITGDKSNRLSVLVNNRTIWRSGLRSRQRFKRDIHFPKLTNKINILIFI